MQNKNSFVQKEINKTTGKQRQWGNPITLSAVLLLLIIVCGLFYAWYLTKHINNYSSTNKIDKAALSDGLPREVFAYTGTVQQIDTKQGIITVFAPRAKNYLLRDQTLQIHIDGQTKFKKIIAPKNLPELKPGESGSYYQRREIKLSDIEVDNQVTAIALKNIKNKTEFTAAQIEVHPTTKK